MTESALTLSQLEQYLSKAAWILKGPFGDSVFKAYIFPVLFFKRTLNDIGAIMKAVRFVGWQDFTPGQKNVPKALRKSLLIYKPHKDQDLFDRAYGYIREYY